MRTRTKIEATVVIVFVVAMFAWAFGCTPGNCMDHLGLWLASWWAGCGAIAIYFIWRVK